MMKKYLKTLTLMAAALLMAAGVAFFSPAKADAAASMTAATLNYPSSTKNAPTTIYTSGSANYVVYSIDVKAAGKLYVDALAYSNNSTGANIGVGTFDGTTFSYTQTRYVSPGQEYDSIGFCDVKAGTYYVGIQCSKAANVYVTAYVIPYGTRSLAAGKQMIASAYKNDYQDSAAKFKIKPKKSGYITVALKEYGSDTSAGYVTLLNSKKKAVSEKLWYYTASDTSYVCFGVKKGVTYYLKVQSCQGSSQYNYSYAIRYKMKAALLKNNTKKGKSVLLKRKAKYKNMTRPATGKAMNQWYKFKVPKKQTTKIRVDAAYVKSGDATVTLYAGSSKIGSASLVKGRVNTYTVTHSTTYGKANPGTYYLRITSKAKCSGMYRIRYLK